MGFGDSAKPDGESYTLVRQAELVAELIARLGIQDYVLGGHSYGGGVALQMMRHLSGDRRDDMRGLLLIDTVAYPQKMPTYMQVLRSGWLAELTFALVPRRVSTRKLLEEIYFDDSKITEETVDAYAYYLGLPGAQEAMIRTAKHIIPKDMDDLVASYQSIEKPTMIIWGECDELIPAESGERLSDEISESEFVSIPDCGHAPHEEMPERTAYFVRGFLSRLYEGGRG